MRRLLAVLLLGTSLAVPASAETPAPELVLRGSRAASVEVTFATRFRPRVGLVDATPNVRVSTRGTYAGAYFEHLTRPFGIGVVVVPSMAGGRVPFTWGGADREDFSLPAGRYRVHLLTDGASTVRIGVDGVRGRTFTPSVPTLATARLVKVDAIRAEIPVTVRSTTTTLLAASAESGPGAGGATSVCLDEGAAAPCETGTGIGGKFVFAGPGTSSSQVTTVPIYPGDVPSGEHTASYTLAPAAVPRSIWAFALTIR